MSSKISADRLAGYASLALTPKEWIDLAVETREMFGVSVTDNEEWEKTRLVYFWCLTCNKPASAPLDTAKTFKTSDGFDWTSLHCDKCGKWTPQKTPQMEFTNGALGVPIFNCSRAAAKFMTEYMNAAKKNKK